MNVESNKRAIYDLSHVLTDYIEMQGDSDALNTYMKQKHLGSDAQIETRWQSFFKFFKNSYLRLKKVLDFKK